VPAPTPRRRPPAAALRPLADGPPAAPAVLRCAPAPHPLRTAGAADRAPRPKTRANPSPASYGRPLPRL